MNKYACRAALLAVLFLTVDPGGFAQVLTNASLSGKYFARHIEFTTDSSNTATDARSIVGAITFDGNGNYAFAGQQVIGTGAAAAYNVNGTYSVAPAGFVNITNPQNSTLSINARYGTEAVFGSSTSAIGSTFDFFIAIPAPAANATPPFTNATLGVNFHMADWELTGASTAQVRVSGASAQFSGLGAIALFSPLGHTAAVGGGATQTGEQFTGTYTVNSDGTGTIAFAAVAGTTSANLLMAGAPRNLYISATRNVFLAATPGAHDILIGLQNAATSTIGVGGRYWLGLMETDSTGTSQDQIGSASAVTSANTLIATQLNHSVPAVAPGAPNLFTETTTQGYANLTSGFGQGCKCGIGTGGNIVTVGGAFLLLGNNGTLVGLDPGQDANANASGTASFPIVFGEQIPAVSGAGVFVNPQGIVNAATYAPVGDNISPGEFIQIYGSGLASGTATATALPFPPSLNNVSVSIGGFQAPLYYVSPNVIDCIVPYEVVGTSANIIVTNSNVASNTVSIGVVATTPGVFSANDAGYGDGAVTHVNNTLVTPANPAAPGETVQMYVSGLGLLSTPVADGSGFGGVDDATVKPLVLINNVSTSVGYWGLTADAGLYQINFTVPANTPPGEQTVTVASFNGSSGQATATITIAVQ